MFGAFEVHGGGGAQLLKKQFRSFALSRLRTGCVPVMPLIPVHTSPVFCWSLAFSFLLSSTLPSLAFRSPCIIPSSYPLPEGLLLLVEKSFQVTGDPGLVVWGGGNSLGWEEAMSMYDVSHAVHVLRRRKL